LAAGETLAVGVAPVGSVCAVAAGKLVVPLVTVANQLANAPDATSRAIPNTRPTTQSANLRARTRRPSISSYLVKVRETGRWNVAPWHPLSEARLMAAAPGRSMRCDPAATAMEGLDGKLEITPVVAQVPSPPAAVIDPFKVIAVRVTENELGLLTRNTTSLEVPGRRDVVGASPPVNATTLGDTSVVVAPEPEPDPTVLK
jgi:hypothetical protein